jgi:hypothetical protein
MKGKTRPLTKLKLSKETLRDLTENRLRDVVGGISGQPIPDSCTYTEGFSCSDVAACSCFC